MVRHNETDAGNKFSKKDFYMSAVLPELLLLL